jgi:hypothetical protein
MPSAVRLRAVGAGEAPAPPFTNSRTSSSAATGLGPAAAVRPSSNAGSGWPSPSWARVAGVARRHCAGATGVFDAAWPRGCSRHLNLAIDAGRVQPRGAPTCSSVDAPAPGRRPGRVASLHDDVDRLRRALTTLPEQRRVVLAGIWGLSAGDRRAGDPLPRDGPQRTPPTCRARRQRLRRPSLPRRPACRAGLGNIHTTTSCNVSERRHATPVSRCNGAPSGGDAEHDPTFRFDLLLELRACRGTAQVFEAGDLDRVELVPVRKFPPTCTSGPRPGTMARRWPRRRHVRRRRVAARSAQWSAPDLCEHAFGDVHAGRAVR